MGRDVYDVPDPYDYHEPDLGQLAWTTKSELGHWLRRLVAACFPSKGKVDFEPPASNPLEFSPCHFTFVRGVLEQIDDISMLADVLSYVSDSRNEAVLASAEDTVNSHL